MAITKRASKDAGITALKNLATGKYFYYLVEEANTWTLEITGDTVFALKDGKKAIGFPNPMEGTIALELQVYPFELYAIFGDGTISEDGSFIKVERIKATEAGKLNIPTGATSVSVTSLDDMSEPIAGTTSGQVFTATTSGDIVKDSYYYAIYTKLASKKVTINDSVEMPDYEITTTTPIKDEDGEWGTEVVVAHKATAQRNISISHDATGDPATLTVTFDLLTDKNGEFVDIMEV